MDSIAEIPRPRAIVPPGSVDKALILVRTLLDLGGRSSLAELCQRSGLPKSTTHRLLSVLEAHGMVARASEGYRLGELAGRLAGWRGASRRDQLVRCVKPHLMELAAVTRELASLVVLDGLDAHCVDCVYDHDRLDLAMRSSHLVPAHTSAAGKLLLAMDSAAADRVRRKPWLAALTPHTITAPRALITELAEIRLSGIARMRQESLTGVAGLAVAVTGPGGNPVAALSVAGAADGFDWAGVEHALRQAGQATSATLRGRLSAGQPARRIPSRSVEW